MKTFKCDLCGAVFGDKCTSHIKFYNRYTNSLYLTPAPDCHKLKMPNVQDTDMCEYDICPNCFDVLRNTLWSLRGKVLTNISTNIDDREIIIPCGNNGAKIVFNIDVIKGDDQNE